MKQAYIFLAEGFEEIEALSPADYLRRAGIEVTLVGLNDGVVTGSHNISVVPDTILTPSLPLPDLVVLPGGMPGARNLSDSTCLRDLVTRIATSGAYIAAICAAPAVALYPWGLLTGKKFTCYPGMQPNTTASSGTTTSVYTGGRITIDGKLVTAAGPGTAEEFSLTLVSLLAGNEIADQVSQAAIIR